MKRLIAILVTAAAVLLTAAPGDAVTVNPPTPFTLGSDKVVIGAPNDHYDVINTVCVYLTLDQSNRFDFGERLVVGFGQAGRLTTTNTDTTPTGEHPSRSWATVCANRNQYPAIADWYYTHTRATIHMAVGTVLVARYELRVYGYWGTLP